MGQLVSPFRSSCLWLVGTVVGQLVKPFRLICPWMLGYGAGGLVKLSRKEGWVLSISQVTRIVLVNKENLL